MAEFVNTDRPKPSSTWTIASPQKRTLLPVSRNFDVAVALSLAAGHEAMVELWADPAAQRNTHEILIRGDFGQADIHVANLPSPDNPATSYLAALSALSLLHDLDSPLVVGT